MMTVIMIGFFTIYEMQAFAKILIGKQTCLQM